MLMRPFSSTLMIALVAALGACTTTPQPEPVPIGAGDVVGKWSLTNVGKRSVSRAMTMEFRRGGLMVGTSRCNNMSGTYEVLPPTVVFPGPVIITVAGCGGDHPSNEPAAETAERVLFTDPPSSWSLSRDRQWLLVHGQEQLRFARAR